MIQTQLHLSQYDSYLQLEAPNSFSSSSDASCRWQRCQGSSSRPEPSGTGQCSPQASACATDMCITPLQMLQSTLSGCPVVQLGLVEAGVACLLDGDNCRRRLLLRLGQLVTHRPLSRWESHAVRPFQLQQAQGLGQRQAGHAGSRHILRKGHRNLCADSLAFVVGM